MPLRRLIRSAAALAVGSAALVAAPGAASAAPVTCLGKPVTIVATTSVTKGTEGDDVVAMEPGEWNNFDAKGGNDTICLAAGKPDVNDRDPRPPSGILDAGVGDDMVVNLTPAGTTGIFTTVVLGLGNDSFQGADVGETVYAEDPVADFADPYALDPAFTAPQTDTVTGAATVFSAAPVDGANQDSVTFSAGASARLVFEGPQAPAGVLDFSAAASGLLEMRGPRRLSSGEVYVDSAARNLSAGGASLVSWIGNVDSFHFGTPHRGSSDPIISFAGTDADEAFVVTDGPVGDVVLGGGDDHLHVEGLNSDFIPRSADGGPGEDTAALDTTCHHMVVRLEGTATCDGAAGSIAGFEDVIAGASWDDGSLRLVGTNHSERLVASAQQVSVRGRAGADEIGVDESYRAWVSGGPGRDRLWVSGDDVVVRGQRGNDRIILQGSGGLSPVGRHPRWRQHAAGGRGRDLLIGTIDARPDRLLGGRGRDRANGRKGDRDLCRAEMTKRCERR